MAGEQCGLCLSCGAPFPPKSDEIVLFNHVGNMSVLYAHTRFVESPVMQRRYQKPVLVGQSQRSHIVHGSHHEDALKYMCYHHQGDRAVLAVNVGTVIGGGHCMFLFYKHPTSKRDKSPSAASWARPDAAKRIDFSPLFDKIQGVSYFDRDADFSLSFNLMYPICNPCNSIMTSLAKMRYLLGFDTVCAENPNACVIPLGESPISVYAADPKKTSMENAYGVWQRAGGAGTVCPQRIPDEPVGPFVAYYLHLCLPHAGGNENDDVFDTVVLRDSKIAARRLYLELSWVILEIACMASLVVDGKARDQKVSHGLHQPYGVLDLYVSFFMWRLLQFEYPEEIAASALDFVQWHQKYYCVALGCHKLGLDSTQPVLALSAFGSTAVGTKTLLKDICAKIIGLYDGPLQPLIMFVTNRIHPGGPALEAEDAARRYFLPLRYMVQLRRECHDRVRDRARFRAVMLF